MTFAMKQLPKSGTFEELMAADSITQIANDGNNEYLHLREECRNSLPVSGSTELRIPLTNKGLHVVQFDKSFISIKATIKINMSTLPSAITQRAFDSATDEEKATLIFIGYKNSSDAIKSYALYHNGKQVSGTRQSNAALESMLYHAYRGEEELCHRVAVHSRAADILTGQHCFCGTWVSLAELRAAKKASGVSSIDIGINLEIPFNDILLFQQFEFYPSAIFGDLELRMTFNTDSLVVLPVDPSYIVKRLNMNDAKTANSAVGAGRYLGAFPDGVQDYPTHEYTQIGDQFTAITSVKNLSAATATTNASTMFQVLYTTGDFVFEADNFSVDVCASNLAGFNLRADALDKLDAEYQQKPWIKFSQNVNYFPYTGSVSSSGVSLTQQIYLNNTTDLVLRFPTTTHERENTVSKNPMMSNVSLTVMNRRYPEHDLDTFGGRFNQMMLNASDQFFQSPNEEYAHSLELCRWDDDGVKVVDADATSFLFTIKVERPSAMGLICDGLDSNGHQVSARLQGSPTGGEHDGYCSKNPPPPELITVNDSFFIFSSEGGGRCVYEDREFNASVQRFMSIGADQYGVSRRALSGYSSTSAEEEFY